MTIDRRTRSRYGNGFTLIELLVAIAVLAVVSSGVFSLVAGTLRFTERSRAVSVSLEDIANTEGYLNDTLKFARLVYASLDVTVPAETGPPGLFRCRLDGDTDFDIDPGRCIAAAVPVLDGTQAARIIDYDIVLLSVEPIGQLYEANGLPRGYDGRLTLALLEYRIDRVCLSAGLSLADCEPELGPADLPITAVTNDPGVLLVGLDDQDEPIVFFAREADSLIAVTLAARAGSGRSETLVVRNSNISLQVLVREARDEGTD